MAEQYAGWKNAQTQVVYVSIRNNQQLDGDIRRIIEKCNRDALAVAVEVQSYIEERNPLPLDSMPYRDLMTLAFHAVDWDEVAEELLKD